MMHNSNSKTQQQQQQQMDWELRPGGMLVQCRETPSHHHHHDHSEPLIKINASYGPTSLEIPVPPHSTFGDLKKLIEEKIGVEPKRQRILFRGKQKDDDGESLHEAGVKDKSKILVLEEPPATIEEVNNLVEEKKQNDEEMAKAFQAITDVSTEVDKLADRVMALEVAVNGGTKVADEVFVVSAELLMRQLLKLDAIDAEGEAKMLRKAEVRRVQNFHDTLDNLKVKNSKPFSNSSNSVSVTTEWENFDSGVGSLNPPPPMTSSTSITQDWERFD